MLAATAGTKLAKRDGAPATPAEATIADALYKLQTSSTAAAVRDTAAAVKISGAREVDVDASRKAFVVTVPFPLLAAFKRGGKPVIEELEKKTGSHVVVVGDRTVLSATSWSRSNKYSGVRPRSRTLKSVQEALLDDVVFPAEITGKRTRVSAGGGRVMRVFLSSKEAAAIEGKLDTFRQVYKNLTNKDVHFEVQTTH